MTIRSVMTNRCNVERDLSSGQSENDWGGDEIPQWSALHTDLPCRVWEDQVQSIMDSGKLVETTMRRMAVPKGTDITEDDRVVNVRNRLGAEVADGPMRVDSVIRRQGYMVVSMVDVR